MKITLRETDVLARLGGDEFAALLVEADVDRGRQVTDRLRKTVQGLRLISEEGGDLDLSVSIGAAHFPVAGADAKALLREADIALYRAKRRGRQETVVATAHEAAKEFERNRSSGRPGPPPDTDVDAGRRSSAEAEQHPSGEGDSGAAPEASTDGPRRPPRNRSGG